MPILAVLTEIATGLYRLLARQLSGYETAKARQIYRHFLDTPAQIEIGQRRVEVQFPKRAHNPLLIAAEVGHKNPSRSRGGTITNWPSPSRDCFQLQCI